MLPRPDSKSQSQVTAEQVICDEEIGSEEIERRRPRHRRISTGEPEEQDNLMGNMARGMGEAWPDKDV